MTPGLHESAQGGVEDVVLGGDRDEQWRSLPDGGVGVGNDGRDGAI